MKPRYLVVGLLAFIAACGRDSEPPTAPDPSSKSLTLQLGTVSQKRYIVVLQENTVNSDAVSAGMTRAMGVTADYVYHEAIKGFAAKLSDHHVQELRLDGRVRLIEQDQAVYADGTESPTPAWGIDRIDQRTLPLNNQYLYGQSGVGVHFYSIDTGVLLTHSDFTGRIGNGYDAVTLGGTANDCNGHGTHTSGTAGGTVYGVAKSIIIHPVRVLSCAGSGTWAMVIAGVDWVRINRKSPAVANMSLGGVFSSSMNLAVANAVAAGVVMTASAGNSNADACKYSPASEPSAITVGATDGSDNRASFSNFGKCLDLFAPGVSIKSDWIGSNTATASASGTSMSAPHVAGVSARYLEVYPTATPSQVASAIASNATSGLVKVPGSGSPNLLLYSNFIGGATPPPPNQAPKASFTFSCTDLACSFNGSSSTDDIGITSYSWKFGDGKTGSGVTASHSYPSGGTYTVTLTVTDTGSLTNSTSKSVTVSSPSSTPVNQPPVAVAKVTCLAGRTCTFDGTSSTDDVGIVAYVWRTDEGNVASSQPILIKTFVFAGLKSNWSLTVKDGAGLSATKTFSFTVLP